MHKILINKIEYSGPAQWDELTAADLLQFAKVSSRLGISAMSRHVLVMLLMRIPYKIIKQLKEFQMLQLLGCTSWLEQTNTLSKWLIKSVKSNHHTWYGPADKLANITGNEFMYLENAYESWLKEPNDAHLDVMFAVLYHKKHWLKGTKNQFDAEKLKLAISQTSSVSQVVKYAVAINYAGCRNLIIKSHPYIWKKALQNQQGLTAQSPATSWASIFLQLAGDKFGTYQQTINSKVWLLLADLDHKSKQAKEMEAQQ